MSEELKDLTYEKVSDEIDMSRSTFNDVWERLNIDSMSLGFERVEEKASYLSKVVMTRESSRRWIHTLRERVRDELGIPRVFFKLIWDEIELHKVALTPDHHTRDEQVDHLAEVIAERYRGVEVKK